jgi:hypothetical protein
MCSSTLATRAASRTICTTPSALLFVACLFSSLFGSIELCSHRLLLPCRQDALQLWVLHYLGERTRAGSRGTAASDPCVMLLQDKLCGTYATAATFDKLKQAAA